MVGAEGGIRTPTPFRAPAPQAGASAVSPLPRDRALEGPCDRTVRLKPDTTYYLAGAGVVGAGAGAGFAVAGGGACVPLTTEPEPRCPITESVSANSMNNTAAIDVAFVNNVAPDRAPKAAWLLLPPNALAISPPRPCCRRITSESTRHTST